MSFHLSASDIELDGTTLKANLNNVEGEAVECEIDLDDILGNDDGRPVPFTTVLPPKLPPKGPRQPIALTPLYTILTSP